jgi:hypothetical protein
MHEEKHDKADDNSLDKITEQLSNHSISIIDPEMAESDEADNRKSIVSDHFNLKNLNACIDQMLNNLHDFENEVQSKLMNF